MVRFAFIILMLATSTFVGAQDSTQVERLSPSNAQSASSLLPDAELETPFTGDLKPAEGSPDPGFISKAWNAGMNDIGAVGEWRRNLLKPSTPAPPKPPCPNSWSLLGNISAKIYETVADTNSRPIASTQIIAPNQNWNAACSDFITRKLSYGPIGNVIVGAISPETHPNLFTNRADAAQVCPAFTTMSNTQKTAFWVWFAAAVSMRENSCKRQGCVNGSGGGKACGLFQLYQGRENQFPHPPAPGSCPRNCSTSGPQSAVCFMKMLDNQLGKRQTFLSEILGYKIDQRTGKKRAVWQDNYWQVLQNDNDSAQLVKLIHDYAPCQTGK